MGFRYRLVALLLAAVVFACSPCSQVSANTYPLFRMQEPFTILNEGMSSWGYINTTGAWVIRPQFESAFRWTERFATVSRTPQVWFVATRPNWRVPDRAPVRRRPLQE